MPPRFTLLMFTLEGMRAKATEAVMRSRRAWAVAAPVAMIAPPPVITAGGKPVIPEVAPGERPTLPVMMFVPVVPAKT